MKIPFLFVNGEKFVIYFGRFEFVEYDARWIGENDVGDFPLVPEVDLVKNEDVFIFDNKRDAFKKMRELWSQVKIE